MNSRMLALTRSGYLRKTVRLAGLVAAACVFGASAVPAQSAAPGDTTGAKLAVINVRQAIASTAEGKQAGAELQSQFAPRQTELEGLNKQINDLRQRMDAGAKLSPEEQTRLQREGEAKARQLQRKQDEYQEDVNAAQADVFDRIGRKMIDVLDRYAREHGYVAVLDTSAQNTPILFASTNIDVTQDIVKLYDQAYPVKGGAPAATTQPKPAQRPAAQPPAAKPPQR